MIVRSCLARRAPQQSCAQCKSAFLRLQQFHSSASRRDEIGLPNHYQTLDVEPNASPGEIKKQFYKLSKSHHPDLHPNDSSAPQRFVKISEAYATLGSPEKRARYDRDYFRSSHSPSAPNRPTGSYSSASTSPFGGRPASGLSRRRSQFRGPPPSFYSSGGWGQHSEKRGDAASQASHTHEAQGRAQSNAEPGMGPGGAGQGYDVPHFDQQRHAQTQSKIQQHRAKRKTTRDRMDEADREREGTGGSVLFNFTWVSGFLLAMYYVSQRTTSDTSVVRKPIPVENGSGNGNGNGQQANHT